MNIVKLLTAKDIEVLPCVLARKSPPYKYAVNRDNCIKLSLRDKLSKRDYYNCDAYCILCGNISNNLECIDFDCKAVMFDEWANLVDESLFAKLYIESTLKGGKHVLYHCLDGIEENRKLAYNEDNLICIETRGNGGLVVTAPTENYTTLQGDILNIPYISADERQCLIENAVKLNRNRATINVVKKQCRTHEDYQSSPEWIIEPINDFNNRFDINNFLISQGWKIYNQNGDKIYYTRPNKNDGVSASWNGETFYVFTTNVAELNSEQAYNPFQLYSAYVDNNNMSETYKRIINNGYGQKREFNLNIQTIINNFKRRKQNEKLSD